MNYPRGTGLWARIIINIRESLRPKNIKSQTDKKFVKTDYLGNSYYEIAADPSRHRYKSIRSYMPPSKNFDDFDVPLPPEWDAWLRHRRVEAPTDQEIEFHLAIMEKKRLFSANSDKTNELPDGLDKNPFTSFPMHKEYEISPGLTHEQSMANDPHLNLDIGKQRRDANLTDPNITDPNRDK